MPPEETTTGGEPGFYFGASQDPVVEQFRGLVELARWSLVLALAIYSIFLPFFGIIFGIILMKFAVVPKNQGLGKLCLILGFLPFVFLILYCLIWVIIIGGLSGLSSIS